MATAKMAYGLADYIQVDGAYELMGYFTSLNESPNAETEETQYTTDKSKSVDTVSYQTSWAFEGVLHKDDNGDELSHIKAVKFLEKVGKEQLLGEDCQTLFCRVELDNPIMELDSPKANTFYARQCKVAVEVSEMSVEAGAKRGISGNLNAIEDVVVGEFNTQTKTFTPASEA